MTDPNTQTHSADDQARLLAWLETHDELCPACRYSLRGLAVTTCPECNARLTLSVAAPDLRLGAWLLVFVSFTLGLGFDAVMGIIITTIFLIGTITNLFQGGGGGPPLAVLIVPGTLFSLGAACLAGLLLCLRWRRRWVRLTPVAQWKWGGLTFVLVGLVHLCAGAGLVALASRW